MTSTLRRRRIAATATAGVLALGTLLLPTTSATAAPAVLDGSSALLAAPSCWSIKQSVPASTDGIYWLQTAKLVAPEQFYCDMTTNGGGWVLVGRGRENWTWTANGQGTPAQVRTTPTGTGAFAPATLPSATIDGLLDGGSVTALPDGIRLTRSLNQAGSSYQEDRLFPTAEPNWNWTIGGGILVSNVVVDGASLGGGNTQAWGTDQYYRRLATTQQSNHAYKMGFGYGSKIVGKNDPASYLWSNTTEGNALPFTQVWIRPKLLSSTYTTIPDSGLAASTIAPRMKDTTEPTPWGVTGIVGGYTGELTEQVQAFAFIGSTAYVGGMFQYVQKGPNPAPADKITQSYLAAFDITTGEWVSSFRPVLNGGVWDLQATPDGKLIVGGEFTSVNGAPKTQALAELDPTTGAVVPGWSAYVNNVNKTSPASAQVRAMDIQGGWLYLGGRFTQIQGSTSSLITVGRAARVRLSDGLPDGTWKPNFDGTIIELDASDQGDRVYMTGYFNHVNGTSSANVATVSTASGAPLVAGLTPWQPSLGSGTKTYQQTVKEVGGSVWIGGSQHILSKYNRADFARQTSNITQQQGGDFQSIAVADGVVYASCHCTAYTYSGTYNFSTPIPNASRPDVIQYIGAWDATTGAYIPGFFPNALDAEHGNGPWAMEIDPRGCLWFGGDMTRGSWTGTAFQWLGGFGSFCPRDTSAPTTPTDFKAARSGGNVTLTWGASTDASPVTYQVLRDDRVIATLPSTVRTLTTPEVPSTVKYFVRAVDSEGNYSATTTALTVATADTSAPTAPGAPTASNVTSTSASLSWTAATDDTGVAGYRVLRGGVDVSGALTGVSFTDSNLQPATAYSYSVVAFDAAGNTGPASPATVVTTLDGAVTQPLFTDTWTQADGSAWGSTWATGAVSGSVTAVGGAGQLAYTDTTGAYAHALLGVGPVADADATFTYQLSSTAARSYIDIGLRGSGGWQNGYRVRTGYYLELNSTSSTVSVAKNVNGTVTTLATVAGGQTVTTAKQHVRLQVVGSTIRFRTWADGATEPAAWTWSGTDTSVATGGQFWISINRAGTNVGAKSLSIDDFTLMPLTP